MDIDGRAMKLFADDFRQLLVNCVTSPRLRLSAGKALFLTRIHLPTSAVGLAFPIPAMTRDHGDFYPFAFSNCSACCRDVSVSFSPLSMRAISSVCSAVVSARTSVLVRPAVSRFSIK